MSGHASFGGGFSSRGAKWPDLKPVVVQSHRGHSAKLRGTPPKHGTQGGCPDLGQMSHSRKFIKTDKGSGKNIPSVGSNMPGGVPRQKPSSSVEEKRRTE